MHTTRLEAFSDAVIAIIITIMALELKTPHDASFAALRPLTPIFLAYVMSFVYLGIYWNNHHHLLHATDHVDGKILWANMHLLFWLSLIPFATAWMSEHGFATLPTALYGTVLLMAALAYTLLTRAIIAHEHANHAVRDAIGTDLKGNASLALYLIAIAVVWLSPAIAIGVYLLVALLWIVPDRRIARHLGE